MIDMKGLLALAFAGLGALAGLIPALAFFLLSFVWPSFDHLIYMPVAIGAVVGLIIGWALE